MREFRRILLIFAGFSLLLGGSGCTRRHEIWIYTSLPKEVIQELVEPLHDDVPEADVKWYQSSSEGFSKADLVMTSDLFWYEEMKRAGKLLPYASAAAADVPAQYRDPEGAFAAVRMPVAVLAYNSHILKPNELPERWKDLADPRWKNRVSMGSPLESSSTFLTVAILAKTYGWEYFHALRKNELVAEGGHASVLSRLETGERAIGVLTLDALLKAQAKGSPARVIYPLDGVIPLPCPLAIMRSSEHPEVARKVYDWLFSTPAQNVMVRSGFYSPLAKMASTDRARPWNELKLQLMPFSPQILNELFTARDQTRAKFSEIVLH